jgi:hypothetical protein
MIVISRDGDSRELRKVFEVAERPNVNYQIKPHEVTQHYCTTHTAMNDARDAKVAFAT